MKLSLSKLEMSAIVRMAKIMALADGVVKEEEMKLINVAIELIERYSDNFILVKMPNPTIELVKATIREACLTRQIDHVFYDYIFIGPALLNEFRGFTLRNDEVLSFDESNKLTFDNQTINDLLSIINAMDAEIPYAEYTKQEFDKYLNSIVYKP